MTTRPIDIAIIGVSGRFPDADDVSTFWRNLCESKESIRTLEDDQLRACGVLEADLRDPAYVKRCSMLRGVDEFDPSFFKISPAEAEVMDPQLRLLLQCAWEAMEDAGYASADARNVGVFAGAGGITTSYYSHLANRCKEFEKTLASPTHLGNDKDFLATYISYRLNLTGPSLTVQTACSTSLVAVHQACLSLLADECEMALAGGVRVAVPHAQGYCYREGYIFSRSGQVRAFDADADGVVFGSGLGLVVLKRLERAVADRDQIYAVIKATSICNDGRDKLSYAASSARGQIRCIKNALDRAQVDASTIGYVEAHGTGTLMGDPEEVKALSAAFKSHTEAKGFCVIGSVKTNIGHLDAAAGIASLIKASLVLRHGVIPPTLNFRTPNPRIRFERTPFLVNRELQQFPASDAPRRAAVNSLGVGGTNAFVILEEYRPPEREPGAPSPMIVPLSARTQDQLKASCERLLSHVVDTVAAGTEPRLADIAYTLQLGRACMKHRVAFVVESIGELRRALEDYLQHADVNASVMQPAAGDSLPQVDGGHDSAALVRELVQHQRWAELARCWVSGTAVEWASLHGACTHHRVGLPTYPFARQRYWIDADSDRSIAPVRPNATIHPLLRTNTSTFTAQSYRADLTFEDSPVTVRTSGEGHGGFVPALAYAEILHAAMTDALGSRPSEFSISELQWPSPLGTDASTSVDVTLTPVGQREVLAEISTVEPGQRTVLCRGKLDIGVSGRPGRLNLHALRGRMHEADEEALAAARSFAGTERFVSLHDCGLNELHHGVDELLFSVAMPASLVDRCDAFLFHPALVAGLLEIVVGVTLGGATAAEHLPRAEALESLHVWARCPSTMHLWVRPSAACQGAEEDGSKALRIDVDLVDEAGDICARVTKLALAGGTGSLHPAQEMVGVRPDRDGAIAWDGLSFVSDWQEDAEAVEATTPGTSILVVVPSSAYGFEESLRERYEGLTDRHFHLVRLADETRQLSQREWTCSTAEPEGFSQVLRSIDRIDTLFFLAFEDDRQCRSAEELASGHERFEIQLLRLLKTLKREKKIGHEVHTYLLTCAQYAAGSSAAGLAGGGIPGIGYSLAQGNYQFLVRNVDLERADLARPAAHRRLLDLILAEGASSRGEPLRIAHGRRFRQAFHPLHWEAPRRPPFRQRGVYVILGGTGTVGRIFTRYLIDTYDATVAWIGRGDPDSDRIRDALDAFPSEKLTYFQADATSCASMDDAVARIFRICGPIAGAFFSGQVIDYESSIEQTTEEGFRTILQVKSLGSWNFYRSLEKVRPDFICYFSSGQTYSFSGAAKLSSYASAITFADRLVRSIQTDSSVPVGIINWGFWRSTVKSITNTTKGVSADSIAGLDDHEGIECCEKFLSELQCGRLGQVLCMRVPEQIQPLMRRGDDEFVAMLGSAAADADIGRLDEEGIEIPGEHIDRLRHSQQKSDLDRWLIRRLLSILSGLFSGGVQEAPVGISRLMQKAGVLAKYEPFVRVCLEFLHGEGRIRMVDGVVEEWDAPVDSTLASEWEQKKAQLLEDPDHAAMTVLVDDCLNRLPEVLTGKVLATDVIFPGASMHKVEGVYKHNILSDTFNELLANSVVAYVRQRLEADPSARIRILEIGAGTGGTSAVMFDKLRPFRAHIDEYCYTDLSKAFLFHAEENYLPENPYIRTRRLDVSQPIRPQGFDVGSYDVVLSTNCLHATDNIRRTLANAKAALRRDGLLIINEISSLTLYNHLTFGLLDGWWLFEDPELRIPGCPGLSADQWQQVLSEEGFHSFVFPAPDVRALGQQVVAAHSNGVIRQHRAVHTPKQLPVGGAAAAPTAPPATQAGRSASQSHSSENVRRFAEQKIVGCLSRALKIQGGDVDSHMAFSDYGLDSILGVGFVDQVNKALAINLNTAIIFDFPSVARLTDHVLESREDQVRSLMDQAEPASSETTVRPAERGAPPHGVGASRFVQMEAALPAAPDDRVDEIAVIGMSGMFPKADNTEQFWRNLMEGVDGVEELPSDYLDGRLFSSAREPGKTRCKWGGVLAARDAFDPLFFNLSPREAESMNPHQRLILQEGWKAIEDAGYNPRTLCGTATGVFIGAEPTGYFGETFTGYSDAIVASRLSYHLDLRGPAFVVNTGCSSSGVALHLACESLRNRETTLAIAGGVNACMSQTVHLSLSEIEMLSPSGRCSTFDASGDGTVISEGVGVVVLKRLPDAIADGDPIHGVICASGTNQDGASNGITAPNGSAQEDLITSVYARFGIEADRIGYLEAHGTGTRLGDPIECNALVRAFRKHAVGVGFCVIGSAKSHIGHTAAAAGVIGLIKILLSIKHRKLPGVLHFDTLNPLIEFEDSPFHVNTRNTDWVSIGQSPRMAALNSFGHSGTNAHLVVREHVDVSPVARLPIEHAGEGLAFPLSARTQSQLRAKAADLLTFLQTRWAGGPESLPPDELASIAYTLQVGREPMEKRLAIVAANLDELRIRLEQYLSGQDDAEGVFRGELARGSDELQLFTQDEDMREAISRWVARRKFSKLLKLWVKGLPVNWADFYPGPVPRRQNLPTYPFARDRFWIRDHKALHSTTAVVAAPAMLHPLVQQNVSDFSAQRYCSRFDGHEFFLRDHVVNGQSMLPAVAYLEMARAAVLLALGPATGGAAVELRNVVWASPIVHREGMDVRIGLAACEDGSVEFEILTGNDALDHPDEALLHCRGSAVPGGAVEPRRLDLATLRSSIHGQRIEAEQLYSLFSAMGIDFGPAHRGVASLVSGPDQAFAEIRLSAECTASFDDYVLHPCILDSALQSCIGLIVDLHRIPERPSLPFALESVKMISPCRSEMVAWARSRVGSRRGDKLVKIDITLCDRMGNVCVEMEGFSARPTFGDSARPDRSLDRAGLIDSTSFDESFDESFYEALIDQISSNELSVDDALELSE